MGHCTVSSAICLSIHHWNYFIIGRSSIIMKPVDFQYTPWSYHAHLASLSLLPASFPGPSFTFSDVSTCPVHLTLSSTSSPVPNSPNTCSWWDCKWSSCLCFPAIWTQTILFRALQQNWAVFLGKVLRPVNLATACQFEVSKVIV